MLVLESLTFDMLHYSVLGHGLWSVNSGWPHAAGIVQYFATTYFSHIAFISVILFCLAFAGLYSLRWCKYRAFPLLFVLVPLVYFLYFSTNSVMIIRNYLCLAPFLAVLSARGIFYLHD